MTLVIRYVYSMGNLSAKSGSKAQKVWIAILFGVI